MSHFKVLKCPSCGSSNIENNGQSIVKCEHCGSSLLVKKNKYSQLVVVGSQIRSLLIFIVAILAVFFIARPIWLSFQNDKQPVKEIKQVIAIPVNAIPNIKIPKINMLKVDTKAIVVTNEQIKLAEEKRVKPNISILSKIEGHTSIGGIFWIVKIRNDSEYTVARPGVVMSLFDDNNKRIDEQRAWSAHSHLTAGQESQVMLFIANPPKINYSRQMSGIANIPSQFEIYQETIEVRDFIVKKEDGFLKNTSIVGDVYNPHDYQVDFVKILAVAHDANGIPVGMSNTYATTTSIPSKGQSGFKVSASTFIAQPPASWSLWAVGSKHRDK